ncbi:uncharacterized protein LOC144578672 [Callithrix jacchus]
MRRIQGLRDDSQKLKAKARLLLGQVKVITTKPYVFFFLGFHPHFTDIHPQCFEVSHPFTQGGTGSSCLNCPPSTSPLELPPASLLLRFIWASGLACFVPSLHLSRTFGAFPGHYILLEWSISRDFTGWPKQFVQNSAAGALAALGTSSPERQRVSSSAQPLVTLGKRRRAAGRVRATLSSTQRPNARPVAGSARTDSDPAQPRLPDLLTERRGRGLGPSTSPRPPLSGFSLTHGSRPLPLFSLTARPSGCEPVSRPGSEAVCILYAGLFAPGSRAAFPAVAEAA